MYSLDGFPSSLLAPTVILLCNFNASSVVSSTELASRHYTQGGVRRIPIDEEHVRSLNLAVSAGVGMFEALRQIDGPPQHFPPRSDAPGSH
mmetsp:Transcript_36522/g.58660  ORF Transcript_36522/g.58660 Transcript_36522/m.58660 type:complete len:91 (+) Transcript_36522:882-1154(+)